MPTETAGGGVPEGQGPDASVPFGAAQQFASVNHALTSQAAPGAGHPSGPGQPSQPGGGQPSPPPGPIQPQHPQHLDGQNGTANLQGMFPSNIEQRMNPTPPWRDWIRQAADNHPEAGSALKRLAAQIENQHGPLR